MMGGKQNKQSAQEPSSESTQQVEPSKETTKQEASQEAPSGEQIDIKQPETEPVKEGESNVESGDNRFLPYEKLLKVKEQIQAKNKEKKQHEKEAESKTEQPDQTAAATSTESQQPKPLSDQATLSESTKLQQQTTPEAKDTDTKEDPIPRKDTTEGTDINSKGVDVDQVKKEQAGGVKGGDGASQKQPGFDHEMKDVYMTLNQSNDETVKALKELKQELQDQKSNKDGSVEKPDPVNSAPQPFEGEGADKYVQDKISEARSNLQKVETVKLRDQDTGKQASSKSLNQGSQKFEQASAAQDKLQSAIQEETKQAERLNQNFQNQEKQIYDSTGNEEQKPTPVVSEDKPYKNTVESQTLYHNTSANPTVEETGIVEPLSSASKKEILEQQSLDSPQEHSAKGSDEKTQ